MSRKGIVIFLLHVIVGLIVVCVFLLEKLIERSIENEQNKIKFLAMGVCFFVIALFGCLGIIVAACVDNYDEKHKRDKK